MFIAVINKLLYIICWNGNVFGYNWCDTGGVLPSRKFHVYLNDLILKERNSRLVGIFIEVIIIVELFHFSLKAMLDSICHVIQP